MVRQPTPVRSEERRALQLKSARQGIMLAAARIVIEAGYQATTMRTIAKEAGYTASSLYTYFKSKEEIFEALRIELLDHFEATIEEELPEGLDFQARVAVLTHRLGRFAEDYEHAVALHVVGGIDLAAESGRNRVERMERTTCSVQDWFARNCTLEERHGHRAEDVADLYHGIMVACMERAFLIGKGELGAETLKQANTRGLSFFFAALRAPPQG